MSSLTPTTRTITRDPDIIMVADTPTAGAEPTAEEADRIRAAAHAREAAVLPVEAPWAVVTPAAACVPPLPDLAVRIAAQ
jgi:hypothetical protein